MANNYNGKYFIHRFFLKIFECEYLFYTALLISTDDFENLEFDEGLEQILEEICKSFHFLCHLV